MSPLGQANILLLHVPTPYTRGGAEVLVERLEVELTKRGFNVDKAGIPFSALPKSVLIRHMALWRALPVQSFSGKRIDRVIATKFPSYLVEHANKVTWLIHQHRQAYELYGTRFGDFDPDFQDESLRRMIQQADSIGLGECQERFTISPNVSERLERYLGLDSTALLPPLPLEDRYQFGESENYVLSVGRICSMKRVDLLVRALPQVNEQLRLKIVGTPDEPSIDAYLKSEIDKHHLWHRVEFLGRVSDEDLIRLYSGAHVVYYAPYDEDYGFVTLEALASGKPVLTATDSGGVLEYIRDEENGMVVAPSELAVANALNRTVDDPNFYDRLCDGAKGFAPTMNWDQVIAALTSGL